MSGVQPDCWLAGITAFLKTCQSAAGGYGGGPGQLPHLAVSYATVATLVTLGTQEALQSIDREGMWRFLLSMCRSREEGGGMHVCAGDTPGLLAHCLTTSACCGRP